jgi:S1-C subfamily serine protease
VGDESGFGSPTPRPGLPSPRPGRSPSYIILGRARRAASSPGSGSEFSVQLGPPPHDFRLAQFANGDVAIESVTPGGTAARVGLRTGDTIVRWAGIEVEGNGENSCGPVCH